MSRASGFLRFVGGVAVLVTLAVMVVVGAVALNFWQFLNRPGATETWGNTTLTVESGMGALQVARLLEAKGVVSDARLFYVLCRWKDVDKRLQAGEYEFPAAARPEQVLDRLVEGRIVTRRLTIPEGATVHDVALAVEVAELADAKAILRLAFDPDVARGLGVRADSLEGYLFPSTYRFSSRADASRIVETMVRQFFTVFSEDWRARADAAGMTVHEAVTLASIVEKEAVLDEERPLIAAVFLNRLDRGMRLQSDPTAVYDMEAFAGPITRDHLERESPYNTYRVKGLPPGPICSPGAKSLEAVLHPADVDYLYFVSRRDGSHQFSQTYSEHRKAVNRYRQK